LEPAVADIASAKLLNLTVIGDDQFAFTETKIFEGGDHYVARADFETDFAFVVCGVSF
jgi:hypothetical protein